MYTTQSYLVYKLTNIQLVSRVTTLRPGIIIKLNKEDIMLIIIQGIYTRTYEQQVPLTAQLNVLHAMLAAA